MMGKFFYDSTEMMTVKDFKAKYNIVFTVEAIRYHIMRKDIDSARPARDWFILLTDKTKAFYGI